MFASLSFSKKRRLHFLLNELFFNYSALFNLCLGFFLGLLLITVAFINAFETMDKSGFSMCIK